LIYGGSVGEGRAPGGPALKKMKEKINLKEELSTPQPSLPDGQGRQGQASALLGKTNTMKESDFIDGFDKSNPYIVGATFMAPARKITT